MPNCSDQTEDNDMNEYEMISNYASTLHRTTEEAKQAAYNEQIHRLGQDQPIEWYETETGWEGYNDLGFYLIKKINKDLQ